MALNGLIKTGSFDYARYFPKLLRGWGGDIKLFGTQVICCYYIFLSVLKLVQFGSKVCMFCGSIVS